MNETNVCLAALAGISLVAAIPIAFYAAYKTFVAKTFVEQAKYTALFVIPIVVTFALGELAGITRLPRFSDLPESAPGPTELFDKMSGVQIVLLAIAALIFLAGNKWLMDSHNKRSGKSGWDAANPFKPQFGNYNTRERLAFVIIQVTTLALGFGALIA